MAYAAVTPAALPAPAPGSGALFPPYIFFLSLPFIFVFSPYLFRFPSLFVLALSSLFKALSSTHKRTVAVASFLCAPRQNNFSFRGLA